MVENFCPVSKSETFEKDYQAEIMTLQNKMVEFILSTLDLFMNVVALNKTSKIQ